MRYPPEHKAATRARVLKAAAQQIRERGPYKISVAQVMARAGRTHGAFYAHFASKDALVAEAIEEIFADAKRLAAGLAQALSEPGADIAVALRGYLEAYLSSAHRDQPERGCPLPTLAADMARTKGRVRENFVGGLGQMTVVIEAALARLGRAHAGADANAMIARMVGALSLARALGATAQSDVILLDCLVALLAEHDL